MRNTSASLALLVNMALGLVGLLALAGCQPVRQASLPPPRPRQPVRQASLPTPPPHWSELGPDELRARFTLEEPTSIEAVKEKSLLVAQFYRIENPTIAEVRHISLAEAEEGGAPIWSIENNPTITIAITTQTPVWHVIVNGRHISRGTPGKDYVFNQYQIVWDGTRVAPPLGHAPYGLPTHIIQNGVMIKFPSPAPYEWWEREPTPTATPGGPIPLPVTPVLDTGSTPIPTDTRIPAATPRVH
jgi:hypothetical protein